MKFNKVALILGLACSTMVFANEYKAPLNNVKVFDTELNALSIQNLSNEIIKLDIYGRSLSLMPTSGIKFDCESFAELELQVINNSHDYFSVSCNSRIIFSEQFTNESYQGE